MTIWTIECDGGCGREMRTDKPTVLWTVTTCPDCKREDEDRERLAKLTRSEQEQRLERYREARDVEL